MPSEERAQRQRKRRPKVIRALIVALGLALLLIIGLLAVTVDLLQTVHADQDEHVLVDQDIEHAEKAIGPGITAGQRTITAYLNAICVATPGCKAP